MQRVREFSEESPVDTRIAGAAELVEEYRYAEVHHSDFIRLIADVTSLRSLHVGDALPVSIREIRRQAEEDPAQVTIWHAVDGADNVMGASFELSGLRSAVEAVKLSGFDPGPNSRRVVPLGAGFDPLGSLSSPHGCSTRWVAGHRSRPG